VQPTAKISVLYQSPIGRVLDFHCTEPPTARPQPEYQSEYGATFTKRGAYECRVGRQSACIHSGLLLLTNRDTERVVKHFGALRDDCIDITFVADLMPAMAREHRLVRPRKSSVTGGFKRLTLPVTSELEALQALIVTASTHRVGVTALEVDHLLLDLLRVIDKMLGGETVRATPLDRKSREFYLENIDRAKNFMRTRFPENISLAAVARVAGISVFHFSRLFKAFTGRAPHQYLLQLRLEHTRALLRNTRLSVTEICFVSGFASLEHFLAMFRSRYGLSPRQYRTSRKERRAFCELPASRLGFIASLF
jgi:AraC-like DNA-binding protein